MHCCTTLDKNIGKILVKSAKIVYDLAKTRQEFQLERKRMSLKKTQKPRLDAAVHATNQAITS